MNSNKRINLLVDMVKLGLIILIACAMVSVIVFMVSDDPMTAITSFFIGPFTSLRRIGNIIEAAAPLMFTARPMDMRGLGAGWKRSPRRWVSRCPTKCAER